MQDVKQIRKNPLCVISVKTYGDNEKHDIQINSSWLKNPYDKGYVVVPDNMVQNILGTKGFCNIELNEEGTEVVSFTARDIPETPITTETSVSETEQLRADIDYIAVMTGVEL